MNSTILPQKTAAISSLADVHLNLFGLFGEDFCNHGFDCSLVSTFTDEAQVPTPVTRTM
jgi:hypothetical protein